MCFRLQEYRTRRLRENTADYHSLGRRLANPLGKLLHGAHTKTPPEDAARPSGLRKQAGTGSDSGAEAQAVHTNVTGCHVGVRDYQVDMLIPDIAITKRT